ncbi:agmatine deiminase family protein [Dokdonella koreensis]|uniref:Peptidylarginine deiminase-like enzyme n=1 Tax=Dokdonella koreensis DS-123 TaxID=1300342 RepID=A0A167GXF7_9GAMM|nr:agmatine deiminase family protein [Dokdonella koreensis]ANB18042.1 Peptidylarginine deiminase-like enzyme [Dokdonella koreensis DS-123]
MTDSSLRLPAEWEPQAAILIAWPHAGTDWAPRLAEVETTYVALASAIARFQTVVICVADAQVRDRAAALLAGAGVDPGRIRWVPIPYDDTWLRDSGPITLTDGSRFVLADFRFTGWGGKFEAGRDDRLVEGLVERGLFHAATHQRIDWALEGGAIESDGQGTLLTTWNCLEHRHGSQRRDAIAGTLRETLGVDRVLALEYGYLEGDDTDAHIDTLARLAPHEAIVYQACDDTGDSHHAELERMADELVALRTEAGRPYRLHALPWARPIVDGDRRLAASYANYLIVNDAVLVPAYEDPADSAAAAIIGAAHPGRTVVPIPCRPLIWQNGSLHCVTMQLPAGVLAPA